MTSWNNISVKYRDKLICSQLEENWALHYNIALYFIFQILLFFSQLKSILPNLLSGLFVVFKKLY